VGGEDIVTRIEFLSTVDDGEGHFIVQRRITDDAGVVHEGIHAFPYDTLEWRAAEYDIDPSDVDTLMDIVLAEPYLTVEDWQTGSRLHDADTIEQARVDHIARCARVKLAHRISTRGRVADALRPARENHHMDPAAIAIKRELVAHGRKQRRQERSQPHRIERLQRELDHIVQHPRGRA
jgi:hypothetical protein